MTTLEVQRKLRYGQAGKWQIELEKIYTTTKLKIKLNQPLKKEGHSIK